MTGRRSMKWMVFVVGLALAVRIAAAEDGQADLDKATDLKLKAATLQELGEVATLCEQAIKKGLNPDDEAFAKKLLTGALYQRAQPQCQLLLQTPQLSPALQERRKSTLADLRKILQYDDKFGQAYLMIAQLEQLAEGDREQARQAVDRAVELLSDDKKSLAEALVMRGRLRESDEERQTDFDRAIELDPENPAVWQARALYFLSRGEVNKAVEDFNKLLAKDSDNVMARLAIAESLLNVNQVDEALKHVNHVIEHDPNVIAFTLRAQIWTHESKLDKAVEDIDQALKLAPNDLGLLLMRARLYHADNRHALAKTDIDQVLQAQPNFAPGIELRSSILASLGQFEDAMKDISSLLKRDPDNILLKLQMAIYLNAAGDSRKSIVVFTDILQTNPDNGIAYRGRADAYLNVGAHKEAVADYEVAVKTAADDSGILNNFAWVLATSPDDQLRDGKRAIELGTKACELTQYKQAHILSTLAAAYAESGDFENARKWSEKAVELSDESMKEPLQQELDSYRQNKPWREKKDETQPQPKDEQKDEQKDGTPPQPKDEKKATDGLEVSSRSR